jgi:hypothetical protein
MALKISRRPAEVLEQERWRELLKREVEALSMLKHVGKTPPASYTHELMSALAKYY